MHSRRNVTSVSADIVDHSATVGRPAAALNELFERARGPVCLFDSIQGSAERRGFPIAVPPASLRGESAGRRPLPFRAGARGLCRTGAPCIDLLPMRRDESEKLSAHSRIRGFQHLAPTVMGKRSRRRRADASPGRGRCGITEPAGDLGSDATAAARTPSFNATGRATGGALLSGGAAITGNDKPTQQRTTVPIHGMKPVVPVPMRQVHHGISLR